jgi:protein-S-isoprenylcysteine O-methyltransferase Ste14
MRLLARWRVTLGFVCGALVLWLAQPTLNTLVIGLGFAFAGEALRLWAAGHLEKSREITQTGPYRWTRHPLYLGSSLIAIGVAVASASLTVMTIVAIYMLATIPAAIVMEEAHLREKFGAAYDEYSKSQAPPMTRRFSFRRARFNREHHAIAGVLIGFGLLALKVQLSIR